MPLNRYYESIKLLPPPDRTPAGYRIYGPHDETRLTFIKTAQHLGLSLDEIREILAPHRPPIWAS